MAFVAYYIWGGGGECVECICGRGDTPREAIYDSGRSAGNVYVREEEEEEYDDDDDE